jgi:large-conductance mechanosensitive channel
MTHQPLTPAQTILAALRDLAFERSSPGRWVAVMLLLSLPIAFGVAVSTVVETAVETLILPIVTLPLGNLQSWLIPLGPDSADSVRGLYIGRFLVAVLRFGSTIGLLYLMAKLLKTWGSRSD